MKTKRIAAGVLCLLLAVSVTGCSFDLFDSAGSFDNVFDWFGGDSSKSGSVGGFEKTQSSVPAVTDTSELYEYSMKNTLTEKQTVLYNSFISQIEAYRTEFLFENEDKDDLKTAYFAVMDDHPEYFWLAKSYVFRSKTMGDYTSITMTPDILSEDPAELERADKEMKSIVSRIVSDARSRGDLYEQVKYVHDYIIDNTDYDSDILDVLNTEDSKGLVNASTAYGCLYERKAVCSGYSAAFQLLCSRLGVDCYRVSGTRVLESGAHQWNFLKLYDDYYYTDTTWDDPSRADGVKMRTYEYFLINDSDLARTHTIDDERPVPECSGTRYNYYVYNGLYFDEYDFRYIEDAASRDPYASELSVKFSSPEQRDLAEQDLMENKRIFELDGFSGRVSYSLSASGCILTIRNDRTEQ